MLVERVNDPALVTTLHVVNDVDDRYTPVGKTTYRIPPVGIYFEFVRVNVYVDPDAQAVELPIAREPDI